MNVLVISESVLGENDYVSFWSVLYLSLTGSRRPRIPVVPAGESDLRERKWTGRLEVVVRTSRKVASSEDKVT